MKKSIIHKNVTENYKIIKKICLLEDKPHILNGILAEIPARWANNFETGDIITIINIIRQYRHLKQNISNFPVGQE